jgi:hypothetical protein
MDFLCEKFQIYESFGLLGLNVDFFDRGDAALNKFRVYEVTEVK